MKYTFTLLFLTLITFSLTAQTLAESKWIHKQEVYLRTPKAVVLDSIKIDLPSNGKVWITFEGDISVSPGDVITLAISNYHDWLTNDGNIGVYAQDSLRRRSPFGHSRTFSVEKGINTFYALAHNWTDKYGSGYANIQARYNLMFYPEDVQTHNINGTGFLVYPNTIGANTRVIKSLDLPSERDDSICVSYNGLHYGVQGDLIAYTLHTDTVWPSASSEKVLSFVSSSKGRYMAMQTCMEVQEDDTAVYVLARKLAGNFQTNQNAMYSNFMVSDGQLAFKPFKAQLKSQSSDVSVIQFNAPARGKALVRTTAYIKANGSAQVGMGIYGESGVVPKDTALFFQSYLPDYVSEYFSISKIIDVEAGQNVVYLAGANLNSTDSTLVEGETMIHFIPEAVISSIGGDISGSADIRIYPNPAHTNIHISTGDHYRGIVKAGIFDVNGKLMLEAVLDYPASDDLPVSMLASGLYFAVFETEGGKIALPFIKE